MQNLLEPTDRNIGMVAVNPGTHYFIVYSHDVPKVRSRIYAAVNRSGNAEVHTSYDREKRTLRVVITG